jgi:hypothetical protein
MTSDACDSLSAAVSQADFTAYPQANTRGENGDPIFAVKDRISRLFGILIVGFVYLGSVPI